MGEVGEIIRKVAAGIAVSVGSSPAAAQARLKGKELALGRADKAVETRTAELSGMRELFARAQQTLGEAIEDGVDTTTASRTMAQLESRVKEAETFLAVTLQRQAEAKAAFKNAELLASVEAELFDIGRLKFDVMPRFDAWLKEGERLVREEVSPALNAARISASVDTSWLTDVQLGVKMSVLKAVAVLVPEGRGYIRILGTRTLSDLVIDPGFVKARRNDPRTKPKGPYQGVITSKNWTPGAMQP